MNPIERLRRTADEAEARAAELEAEAAKLRSLAAGIREAVAKHGPLSDDTRPRSMSSMDIDTTGQSSAVKRGVARAKRKGAAQRKLYEQGVTISALATELNETRSRVSAWFAEGDLSRPIPERHVTYLAKRYGIPRSAWARIAE